MENDSLKEISTASKRVFLITETDGVLAFESEGFSTIEVLGLLEVAKASTLSKLSHT